MILLIILAVAVGLLPFQECKAASLFPYGDSEGDARVSTVDDGSSPPVTLSQGFLYFGGVETLLYVNTNGLVSFQEAYAGDVSPRMFPLSSKVPALVAPFWDDIDITRLGRVFYRQTTNSTLLQQVSDQIRMTDLAGTAAYSPTTLFVATWDRVAEYTGSSGASEENTFQAVLATNGKASFVLFVYGSIQWGQASVGFNAGDGIRFFTVPGALGPATRDMETQSNVNVPGLYIYRVDGPNVVSPDGISPYLLFANRQFIQRLHLNGSGFTTVISDQINAFGLDFDYRKKYLYWINVDQYGIIRRASLDGSEVTTIINLQRRFSATDLAIDWINQKLYLVDTVMLRQIEVHDLSSGNQKVLISTGSNTSPRAIAIDPCNRWMYWTSWGTSRNTAKIERASMDGAARVALHSSDLVRPAGLTIDYEAQMLYWMDTHLAKIERSNTDGSARKVITRDNVLQPFAMTVFDNVLYWTDVRLLAVLTRDTGGMKNTTILFDSLKVQPTGIKVIAVDRQPEAQNPCSENNGDCNYLCLLSAVAVEQYSCACPENLTLAQNQRDCVAIVGLEQEQYSVSENSSQGVEVCIIFSGIETVTVTISTQDITAIGGLDYTAVVTIVNLNPGDRECISIPIIDDPLQENTEEFAVVLDINDTVSVKRSTPFARVKIMDVSCISPCMNGICLDPGPGVCLCDPGWRGVSCSEDINECELDNGSCAHRCINSLGGHRCECLRGFTLHEDKHNCEDVNECELDNGSCAQRCINSLGGHRCECLRGFTLHEDKHNCEDINECELDNGSCGQRCINSLGGHRCECLRGFILHEDKHNCEDVNECELDNGSCAQRCINSLGGHRCERLRGFTLHEDKHNCEGTRQCPLLTAPLNGTIECSSQITNGSCNFSCEDGFNLLGSQTRRCLPSATWSGTTPFCEPRQCEKLEAPENGFVLQPCTGEYESSCIIQCKQSNGPIPYKQICTLDNNVLKWTEPPECIELNICETNPCQHGGSCSEKGDVAFECDCEGTSYTGPTCNLGIVTTPDIPTLTKDMMTNSLNISARPDHELIITISGGESIQVSPGIVHLDSTTTTASFTVTGKTVGYYSIRYQLSGENASSFVTPEDAAVFVQNESDSSGTIRNRYFTELGLGLGDLEDSCCEPSDTFFQCQGANASNRIVLRSACNWESSGAGVNSLASAGVVFAVNQDFKLPISIAGIQVNTSSFRSTLPQIALGSCTPCPAVQSNCNRRGNSMCYCYDFSVSDTIDFLESLSLSLNYIRNVRGLLPSWFQDIQAFPSGSNLRDGKYVNYEYTTDLVSADGIRKLHGCEMVQPDNDASDLYSVLRYGRAMIATIDRQRLVYSDRAIQPDLDNPMCFAVNLCKGTESPVFIQLSPRIHSVILSRFLRKYVRRNWDIQIDSVVLSGKAGMSLGSSITDEYWNGVSMFQPTLPQFDLIMNAHSKVHFQTGSLNLDLSFSGKIHYLYKEKEGVMDGETTLKVVAAGERNISLSTPTDSTSTAVVKVADISIEDACLQQDPEMSGIAFKLTYRQRPDQAFFSNLLSFSEETTVCPFDAFMNINDNLELQGFSLYTRCPNLNLGRLTFIGMEHRLYFSGNGDYSQYCLQLDDSIGALQPSLVIYSNLKSNRLPLGRFMTLSQLPESSSPTLVVAYTPESTDSYAKIDSVRVALLDTSFTTNITIANGILEYAGSIKIFDKYSTRLSVSASINEAPWERLSLTIVGVMDDGLDCSSDCFNDQLEDAVHTELRQTGESAFRRQQSAMMSLNRSKEQVTSLESQLNRTVHELSELESARINKHSAQANYQRILNEYEADLRIYHLLEEYVQPSAIFEIANVTFNITIVTESPNHFPLLISYITPHNGLTFQKQVKFNFIASQELVIGQVAQLIVDDYSV